MYKITSRSLSFSIFFVTTLTFISCASSTSITNESITKTKTYCIDTIRNVVIEYPVCSDKIMENQICSINLSDLRPTQFNYGKEYVDKMVIKFRSSIDKTQEFLCSKPVNIVIGPKSVPGFFLTDGHHRMKMLEQFILESSNEFTLLVKVDRNFMSKNPEQSKSEFWDAMVKNNEVYLKDKGVAKQPEELPNRMDQLTNDPYRSLTGYIADDKSKFCFDKNLSSYGNYAEFYWGDFFRKFEKLDEYKDQTIYNFYKNKILYFQNLKTGKRENICKLPDAKSLPGFTEKNALEPFLVIDNLDRYGKPKNFRTSEMMETSFKGNIKGLSTLKASGSGQFSKQELGWIIRHTSINLVLVDLRQEPHGFINGNPVTWTAPMNWTNIGKSKNNIIIDEAVRLKDVQYEKYVKLPSAQNYKDDNLDFKNFTKLEVNTSEREDEVARQFHVGYFRVTVPDHSRPSDEDVDDFLRFVKNLKPDTWLHFHCRGGKGRTTTFLVMYDMLRNSNSVSFNEIIKRQGSISPNYDLLEDKKEDKKLLYRDRTEFIKEFYKFSKDFNKGYTGTWQAWKASKN
jgi:hypothetical protein